MSRETIDSILQDVYASAAAHVRNGTTPSPNEIQDFRRRIGLSLSARAAVPEGLRPAGFNESADRVRDAITPEPAPSAPAEVEALASEIAHTFDRDEDGKGWVFDSAKLAEFARRLSGAQQAAKDGA